jgi:hypothetical protein
MDDFRFELPLKAADGDEFATQYGLFDALAKRVRDQLAGLPALPTKAVVMKAAEFAFDTYVAPFDLPFISNLIEPVVDKQLRRIFLALVETAYDKLAGQFAARDMAAGGT